MNLRTYIDLHQLLSEKRSSHAQSRALALEKGLDRLPPLERLVAWTEVQKSSLSHPAWSSAFCSYLYRISLTLGVLTLLLGFLSGLALLSYNGQAPVNVIYFMTLALFVPLLTLSLALLAMLKANRAESMLVHLSPAYWMEKIMGFLPGNRAPSLTELKVNPLLFNWLVIKRSQLLALLFAVGLLLALLGVVVTKDVAFAWSTTLQVSPENFQSFLHALAWPWRSWLPSAVPSIELIEKSQYFRLGGKLGSEMVANAGILGEWWKFLACATLFYAVFLRFLVWLLAHVGFQKALERSLLRLEGAERLLYQMETPVISTTATREEQPFMQGSSRYKNSIDTLADHYETTLGWALSKKEIALLNDSLGLESQRCLGVGGAQALEEESRIISESRGEVLLYVKAWEPPTMDCVDFITALAEVAARAIIVPVGTAAESYLPGAKALEIWERRLSQINHPKVWLWKHN